MYVNRSFNIGRLLLFTAKHFIGFAAFAALAVVCYKYGGCHWLRIPWVPISVIGTAVAFYVGFKNNSAYDRTWEARKIWGAIVNTSRSWGAMARDFVTDQFAEGNITEHDLGKIRKDLLYRHIAWCYKLRRQLWVLKSWEHDRPLNQRYKDMLGKAFANETVEEELAKFLEQNEVSEIAGMKNGATQLIANQSSKLKDLRKRGLIDDFRHMELQNLLTDLYTQQGKCERIKNFPLPRQYATSSSIFIFIFIALLPFGMMAEFEAMAPGMIWLTIPFTALVGWVYWIMEVVGDYAENPFEGLAFDIPMTALCRTIEIDLREMLGETELPPKVQPHNDILL